MIDPFTIKPLDKKTILENARATKGRIITVEDHYHEGEQGWGGHSPQRLEAPSFCPDRGVWDLVLSSH